MRCLARRLRRRFWRRIFSISARSGGDVAGAELLDLVEQEAAGEEAVEALLAGGLALDLQAGGAMEEHDAGGGLVDVLAAVAAGADEGFFDVRLADAERGHALGELGFFVRADGERGHGGRVAGRGEVE